MMEDGGGSDIFAVLVSILAVSIEVLVAIVAGVLVEIIGIFLDSEAKAKSPIKTRELTTNIAFSFKSLIIPTLSMTLKPSLMFQLKFYKLPDLDSNQDTQIQSLRSYH